MTKQMDTKHGKPRPPNPWEDNFLSFTSTISLDKFIHLHKEYRNKCNEKGTNKNYTICVPQITKVQ